jgi:hypothetical protein
MTTEAQTIVPSGNYKAMEPSIRPFDHGDDHDHGAAPWASEAIAHYLGIMREQLGLSADEVLTVSLPNGDYRDGACAGTLAFRGKVINVGVFGSPETPERTLRALTPVLV